LGLNLLSLWKRIRALTIYLMLRTAHKLFYRVFKGATLTRTCIKGICKRIVLVSPVFIPILTFTQGPLCRILAKLRKGKILEIGSGSGIIALCGSGRNQVVCTDILYEAALTTKLNAEIHGTGWRVGVVATDGASGLKNKAFDVVLINPPYLPIDPKDDLDIAYSGGLNLGRLNHLIVEGLRASKTGGRVIFIVNDLVLEALTDLWGRENVRLRYFFVGWTPLDKLYLIILKR
jgi:SAM-dependent methyltransferase